MTGFVTIVVLTGVVIAAAAQFQGDFTSSETVTVVSDRAGLLMAPGARVKFNGAQIGTVSAVNETSDGRAALQLAIDPARVSIVPSNAHVEVGSATVFGAKSVEIWAPENPSPAHLRAGQVIDSDHVTVEVNTIFQQLNAVLSHIDPAKLNETLGAVSMAFGDRGQSFGRSLTDFNSFLATIEPSYPQLGTELQTLPDVTTAYADAAPDLMALLRNVTAISRTVVDEKSNLDRFLVSTTGLADVGTDVLGTNSGALANLTHLLVPTTALTNEYHEALNCALTGMIDFVRKPPNPVPGVYDLGAITLGIERYRYPQDLPKVAASGGPQCTGQLPIQYDTYPAKVVADVGMNSAGYGNAGILLNSDGLKQWLFGPVDGPPRNTAQWGQPG
ncbi:MCE-family protein [Mycobacterium sp. 1274761.0]|nr:MCE-family protein [Mycobacterium sp. 1274761.0]